MNRERIYKDKLYIVKTHPGCSGFVQYDKWQYSLITGKKLQRNRTWYEIDNMPLSGKFKYFLENGLLPDYQPKVSFQEACNWLIENPYSKVRIEL